MSKVNVGREDLGHRVHTLTLLTCNSELSEKEHEVVAAATSLQYGANVKFLVEDREGAFPSEVVDTIKFSEFNGPTLQYGSRLAEKLVMERLNAAIKKFGGVFMFVFYE